MNKILTPVKECLGERMDELAGKRAYKQAKAKVSMFRVILYG